MPDLDRWEEYAREQRQMGGYPEPDWGPEVDYAEPVGKAVPVPTEPTLYARGHHAPIAEVLEYYVSEWYEQPPVLVAKVRLEDGRTVEPIVSEMEVRFWKYEVR